MKELAANSVISLHVPIKKAPINGVLRGWFDCVEGSRR